MSLLLELNAPTGNYYFSLANETGGWYNTSTSGVEAYASGSYANYAVSMSQVGSLLKYEGSVPSALPTGKYKTTYYQRSGGSPTIGDIIVAVGDVNWYQDSQGEKNYQEIYKNGIYCKEGSSGGSTVGVGGTITNPSSMSDCISINNTLSNSVGRINVFGTNTITSSVSGEPSFYGVGEDNTLSISNGGSGIPNSYCENLTITGNNDSNTIYVKDCTIGSLTTGSIIGNNVKSVYNSIISSATNLNINDFTTISSYLSSPGAAVTLRIQNLVGYFGILNASSISGQISLSGGIITINSGITGTLTVYGYGKIENASSVVVTQIDFQDFNDLSSFDSTVDTVNVGKINSNTNAAARLALTAQNMVPGTIDNTVFSPTTTEFDADDITEATTDHYKNRIIIFTSGSLQGQACYILGYSLQSSRGRFTVSTLTEAPSNNNTFIIV